MENFHSRLKGLRKILGYSQEEFSKIINVSKATLARYENGEKRPNCEVLSTLNDSFKTNLNWPSHRILFYNRGRLQAGIGAQKGCPFGFFLFSLALGFIDLRFAIPSGKDNDRFLV